MSDFMADLGTLAAGNVRANAMAGMNVQKKGSNLNLDMSDFLTLMITELTNQGIDESVDTSDMLNQMIQMQMVEALANMTDASIMSYAASLVGKEITVAKYDSDGNIQEIVGVVQGTGTKNGDQVVFVNDEYYYMNEIMAVGRLPAVKEPEETEDGDKTEGTDKVEDGDKTESETPDTSKVPEDTETNGTENDDYDGESGAPTDPET